MSTNNVPTPFLNHRPRNSPHGYESEKEQQLVVPSGQCFYYGSRGTSPDPVNPTHIDIYLTEARMKKIDSCDQNWTNFLDKILCVGNQEGSRDNDGNVRLSCVDQCIKEKLLPLLNQELALLKNIITIQQRTSNSADCDSFSFDLSARHQQTKQQEQAKTKLIKKLFPIYSVWRQQDTTTIGNNLLNGLNKEFNGQTVTTAYICLRVSSGESRHENVNHLPELAVFLKMLDQMSDNLATLEYEDLRNVIVANNNHSLRRPTITKTPPRTPKVASSDVSSRHNNNTQRNAVSSLPALRLSGSRRSRVYEKEGDDDYSRYSCHRI